MKSSIYNDKHFPSEEEMDKVIKEFFSNDNTSYDDLRARVLNGYSYRIDSMGDGKDTRSVAMHTGRGGVLMILDSFEKAGVPAFIAGESILVYINEKYYSLGKLKIKKNGE